MATTLYGFTWVGDSEPTTGVLAGQEWYKPTSGEIYRRNSSNTAWVFFGNSDSTLGGAVAVSGSTMTGSLLGAPNLPPLTDPDFNGTIRQGGSAVALETSLAEYEKRLYDRVGYWVREQFLSQTKRSGTSANIAAYSKVTTIAQDTLKDDGLAIELPVFESDGVTATPDQLLFYGWGIVGWRWHNYEANTDLSMHLNETSEGSRLIKLTGTNNPFAPNGNWDIATWAFAMR